MSEFSKKLTQLREQRGWSKTYVAKAIGLSSMQTYANWEYGRTEPDFEMLKSFRIYITLQQITLLETNLKQTKYIMRLLMKLSEQLCHSKVNLLLNTIRK